MAILLCLGVGLFFEGPPAGSGWIGCSSLTRS